MNPLQTFSEWLRFFRNGTIVGLGLAVLLFWNSPHAADEIVVAVTVPLILFNCMPIVVSGILKIISELLPKSPQESLPLQAQPMNTEAVPFKYRLILYGIIGIMVSFCAGVAILLASFTYAFSLVPWAIQPARGLSYLLLGICTFPIIAVASFIAGTYYSAKLRNTAILHWISSRATRPLTYWPTTVL